MAHGVRSEEVLGRFQEPFSLSEKLPGIGALATVLTMMCAQHSEMHHGYLFGADKPDADAYGQQFSHVYFCRLKQLLPALRAAALSKWSGVAEVVFAERVLGAQADRDTVIFGVLFGELPNKPNILQDLEADLALPTLVVPDSYVGDECAAYFVEDESGRLAIDVSVYSGHVPLVSGICAAFLGREAADGRFQIGDVCLAGIPEAMPRTCPSTSSYVLMLSGISFGNDRFHGQAEFELFCDTMLGGFGVEVLPPLTSISGVIFAGNLGASIQRSGTTQKYGSDKVKFDLEPIRGLDLRIASLASHVPVFIVPGQTDPTNAALPQAPVHKGLLPNCAVSGNVAFMSNPSRFAISGTEICVSSGQNVSDLARYTNMSRSRLAQLCLEARHLAPTAPDTLWCRPFHAEDPFVLTSAPHIYVVGNQPAAERTVAAPGVCVVTVPSFSETKAAVLINLADLSMRTVAMSL